MIGIFTLYPIRRLRKEGFGPGTQNSGPRWESGTKPASISPLHLRQFMAFPKKVKRKCARQFRAQVWNLVSAIADETNLKQSRNQIAMNPSKSLLD